MAGIFMPVSTKALEKVIQEEPRLPELPLITFSVSNPKINPPRVLAVRHTGKTDPLIPLEEYRKLREH